MTNAKKLAEEYFKSVCRDYNEEKERTGERHYWVGYDIKNAFLAGLKAGKQQWHDLRKNPNDLPNDDRIVSDQEGSNVRYVKFRNKWFYLDRTAEANVIAWCEIPKFEENE